MNFKTCPKCHQNKKESMFYKSRSWCKQCCKDYYLKNKDKFRKKAKSYREENSEEYRIYNKKYNENPINRAKNIYKKAKTRAMNKDLKFDLSLGRIEVALMVGKCERSGLNFDFKSHAKYHYNPLAPSIDKIDAFGGYTDENVQVVCNFYNCGKMQSTDEEFIEFCKAVVKHNGVM